MNLLHFRFISIILSSNDGDLNRFDGDRISIYTINILISSIYYIVLWIVFSLKLHYFFTIFHYFIVFASELSNARISGFANTFARSSGSTSSATVTVQLEYVLTIGIVLCLFYIICGTVSFVRIKK